MKRILFIIFISVSFIANAQNSKGNQERLQEIEVEIKQAVDAGDFDKAARLKEERNTRQAIEEAIRNGNYERAEELKNSLSNRGGNASSAEGNQSSATNVYVVEEGSIETESEEEEFQGSATYARLLKSGLYLELGAGMNSQTADNPYMDVMGSAFKVGFGWKIFFGNKGKKSRFGLDVNFINMLVPLDGSGAGLDLQVLRPGVVYSFALSEKMAIDASANIGLTVTAHGGEFMNDYYDYEMYGVALTQSTRLRLHKWAFVGIDIGYSSKTGAIVFEDGGSVDGSLNSVILMYAIGFKF